MASYFKIVKSNVNILNKNILSATIILSFTGGYRRMRHFNSKKMATNKIIKTIIYSVLKSSRLSL